MPLQESTAPRKRLHLRRVVYEGFQREDGLFDIEARLVDTKDHPYTLASGTRPAGAPVHEMVARVTIDREGTIRSIEVASDAVPYADGCERIAPAYGALVGTNLMRGYRKTLHDRLGGVHGCTHVTELLAYLPTAAAQTFASLDRDFDPRATKRPFQLDRCHALEHGSETVRRYYPKWYRRPAQEAPAEHATSHERRAQEETQ
jgi:hypothetical protein